jgi:alkylation response protein AidB-like acyl-CoA dehydrogenase
MDFSLDGRAEAFRVEVRRVLDEHYTEDERRRAHETGTEHSWKLHRALAAAGMLGAAWSVEDGGAGRSQHEMDVLYEEAARAGAPMAGFSTTMVVAESIRRVGTPEQRERLLPRVLAGDIVFALGYSEPDAGSDVASVQTRAERRDDGRWVINGQKAFTTTAEEAEYVFVLARTNGAVPKHRGLTLFLVPTSAEGFSISPVHTLGGERSNMTFYEDVVVDDDARVGDVDAGWQTMLIALDFERGGEFAAEMQRMIDLVTTWALERAEELPAAALRRIGRAVTHTEVAKLLGSQATSLRAQMRPANLEGTMAKLYATEALQQHASALLDTLGPAGALQEGAPEAPVAGGLEAMYRHSIVTTIYGGTSEILRGVIAERWLQLPRAGRN